MKKVVLITALILLVVFQFLQGHPNFFNRDEAVCEGSALPGLVRGATPRQ